MEHSAKSARIIILISAAALVVATLIFISPRPTAEAQTYTGVSTTDLAALRQDIQRLQSRVGTLESQVQSLQSRTNPSITTGQTPVYSAVVIDQNGSRSVAGWDFYFTGRGFAPNEQILISSGGVVVGRANTDAAGGFSAAGVRLPLGSTSFTFTGQSSGISSVATVQGVRDVTSP